MDIVRRVKASRILAWFGGGSLFLFHHDELRRPIDEQTLLSRFDFFSTMMQVAIVVPKRDRGNWMTAST